MPQQPARWRWRSPTPKRDEKLREDKGINLPNSELKLPAMSERAECVKLNWGPNLVDAMHTLDDILRPMQARQSTTRPLLRALTSWDLRESADAPPSDARSRDGRVSGRHSGAGTV